MNFIVWFDGGLTAFLADAVLKIVITDLSSSYVTGPSHMSLYVRPHKGSTLSQWSLGNGTPVTSKGGDYFVFYSHGLQASAWQFWIEVQVGFPSTAGITGQVPRWQLASIKYLGSVCCLHRARKLTAFLCQVLEEQPEGVVTVAIAAHYFSGEDKRSSQLDALKEKFPDWTFPSAWVCTYDLYAF